MWTVLSVVSPGEFEHLSCNVTGGCFFCDRRQEKDETRLLRRNKLTCDKGPVPDSNKGDILDTRLVSEPRGRLSASLWRLHLAGRPFLQGEMEPVYQGEIKKARQRLRLILINETWVSRCRKDLDVIFVKVSVSGQKISFYSRSVGLKGKCVCVCCQRQHCDYIPVGVLMC